MAHVSQKTMDWIKILLPVVVIVLGVHTSFRVTMTEFSSNLEHVVEKVGENSSDLKEVREEVIRQGAKQMVLESRLDTLAADVRGMTK